MPSVEQTVRAARERAGRDFHGVSVDVAARNLRDETLPIEVLDSGFARVYGQISRYFETNDLSLANARTAGRFRRANFRLISDVGFSEVIRQQSGVPFFFNVTPKSGAFRPRRRGEEIPIQFTIHSYGSDWDKHRLRNTPTALSVASDATGYNPIRFLNGVRDMVKPISEGGRNVAVHHLISRRGDLCNMVPWDFIATHAAGFATRRSLGIELEMSLLRDTSFSARALQLDSTVAALPYTEEQLLVLAFLTKKLIAAAPDIDLLRFLGVDQAAKRLVRQQTPGFFTHHTVATRSKVDAYLEFEFPQDYLKGDPLPNTATFNARTRLWNRRIERFHGDKPNGTPLSAWDNLFAKVSRIRSFNLATEVFNTGVGSDIIGAPVPSPSGTGPTAAATAAARTRVAGISRSESMSGAARADLYQRARGVTTTTARVWSDSQTRTEEIANRAPRITSVTAGVAFNYTTGLWERTDTVNVPTFEQRRSIVQARNATEEES